MAKKQSYSGKVAENDDTIMIEINPFDIEKKLRKPLPPPSKLHKDKSKYERAQKFKRSFSPED